MATINGKTSYISTISRKNRGLWTVLPIHLNVLVFIQRNWWTSLCCWIPWFEVRGQSKGNCSGETKGNEKETRYQESWKEERKERLDFYNWTTGLRTSSLLYFELRAKRAVRVGARERQSHEGLRFPTSCSRVSFSRLSFESDFYHCCSPLIVNK